jgi:signal transduction histidine kinase
MKFIVFCTLIVFLVSPVCQAEGIADVPTVDLSRILDEAGTLPLISREVDQLRGIPNWTGPFAGSSILVADLDGDGNEEMVRSKLDYIAISAIGHDNSFRTHDQANFPREFMGRPNAQGILGSGFSLNGPYNLDDDDNPEIVAWGASADQRRWGFWIIEVRQEGGRFSLYHQGEFFLDSQPERKPDDRWDGSYAVIGTVPGLLPDPEDLALILTLSVGLDLEGRGVMAVDPRDGRVIWHFTCGSKLYPYASQVIDLDGDEDPEIVFAGGSTDNLHGEKIGEYSDDHSRLYVLDSRGKEKWSRRLSGPRSASRLAIFDLDPTPGLEIVTAWAEAGFSRSNLQVWSATGEALGQFPLEEPVFSLAVKPGDRQQNPEIFLGTSSGSLWHFQWTTEGLKPIKKVFLERWVRYLEYDAPTGWLIAETNQDFTLFLNSTLQPLAGIPDSRGGFRRSSLILHANGQGFLPFDTYDDSPGWMIVPNPDALPTQPLLRLLARTPLWAWVLAAVSLLALAGWGLLAIKHRQEARRRAIIPLGADHLREARLHLLEDLELSGHGAIAPLRSLRRLLWMLDALKTGIDLSEGLTTRLREIWTDCNRDDLPRLLVILERAQTAEIDHPCVKSAVTALENAQLLLTELKERDFAPAELSRISERLHQEGDTAESALQNLRQEVGRHFICDLDQVLAKVLRANEDCLNSLDVKVETGWAAEAASGSAESAPVSPADKLQCRIDAGELEFILDNLLGNACRAMEGSSRRHLWLTWQTVNGMVKMLVSDTGIGIATEDRDPILQTRFSTKERGGLGLPKSVRILRKYDGELSIKSSSPGGGTTFQLLLPGGVSS